MQASTYFAGLQACTAEQETQKLTAGMVGIGLFIGLSVGMFFVFRLVSKSTLGWRFKTALYILLGLLALPICLGIPLVVSFLMSPWCT